jgi:hypothetical protein
MFFKSECLFEFNGDKTLPPSVNAGMLSFGLFSCMDEAKLRPKTKVSILFAWAII